MACYSPVTERKVAAATPQVGSCLPASARFAATSLVASEPLLPMRSSGSIRDGLHRCKPSNQGPASEHARPNIAVQFFPGRSGLHRPNHAGAQGHLHRPSWRAGMLLDDESVEVGQQQEVCLSARTWTEFQKDALRWDSHHSKSGSVGGLLKEQLLRSESASTACPTPASSTGVLSSVASTTDLSHSADRAALLKQKNVFVDDGLEVEEELFPEETDHSPSAAVAIATTAVASMVPAITIVALVLL